jgi:hypothetical protein
VECGVEMGERGEERRKSGVFTIFIILLVPTRIAGYVLGLLSLMLSSLVEHMFKELELCVCGRHEEERDVEKGGEYSCHSCVRAPIGSIARGARKSRVVKQLASCLVFGKGVDL